MELEGFGVSLVGRNTWIWVDTRTHQSPVIPWEFLQSSFAVRMLVTERSLTRLRFAEAETEWTCVWSPITARDWSGIATILRSASQLGPALIVVDHVEPPSSFLGFLDSLRKEGRSVSFVWMHTVALCIPDAVFAPPTVISRAAELQSVFTALSDRAGRHGRWFWNGADSDWEALVSATYEQGLGLVLTDIEETAWTLLWHRPSDSRLPLERRVPGCVSWIQTGTYLLMNS